MNEAKKIAPRDQTPGERIRRLLCFVHNAHNFNPALPLGARVKPAISEGIAFGKIPSLLRGRVRVGVKSRYQQPQPNANAGKLYTKAQQ